MSDTVPLPLVMGVEPAKPMRNRKATSMPMFWLRAVATVKMMKSTLAML